MRCVKLSPKTGKARNKLYEAGHPDHWIVLKVAETVAFSDRDGPWFYIKPDNNSNNKERWVHQHQDKDFIVKES